ncbi:MerR family transcriptional regulator [Pyrinomonas methylaliphatogenes]|jgi:DNA-binding transcriptional MerR regulator|uniref:Predicted transcriptional regulator n=1 Tax=Pyrinomonas methylaliphatogenes TaxID=454194 RepID=A0A0B6WZN9_9BACT|nr:MerR family transcriptional regulator [Pyrinomonas methylaliphatogenes]MBX5479625.1 MerR family transcriptional regulator [Pyrinomonas methylaliphatogenes]CDM66748.1 predicted transcriptional regulator [Pyrinomonas methylaliphatogenes]
MNRAAVTIPEKLFFKIGEVCAITGVQAHVLRYWESEFPMLAPQKNRAGQRTYRKRDVEMVLRIKELLYEEQYTIAGAKKKLANELRNASKLKVVTPEMSGPQPLAPAQGAEVSPFIAGNSSSLTEEQRLALRALRQNLIELLELLDGDRAPQGTNERR